jgi:CubicO group peptidase (beta-lactamase class C family)
LKTCCAIPPTPRRVYAETARRYGLCAALGKEPNDPLDGFDEFARTAITDWKVPGLSIAVVKDGKVALARGYGVCRIGENTAVDERTVFRIVSCTKSFTATCLGMLVDDGKLKWDDPVTKHLPAFQLYDPYVTREVTIRDLLCHRTGLVGGGLLASRGYDRARNLASDAVS